MQMRNHWKIPKPQMFQHGPESETKGETKSGRSLKEGGEGRRKQRNQGLSREHSKFFPLPFL